MINLHTVAFPLEIVSIFLIMLDQQLDPGELLTGVPLLLLYMQLAFNLLNKGNLFKGTVAVYN
jgi:hypothetical protein